MHTDETLSKRRRSVVSGHKILDDLCLLNTQSLLRRLPVASTIFKLSANLGDLYAESGQTLQGSFSAVSHPIFESNYSLKSSRRDLHNALLCIPL